MDFSDEFHQRMKVYAFEQGISIKELIVEAVSLFMEEGSPPDDKNFISEKDAIELIDKVTKDTPKKTPEADKIIDTIKKDINKSQVWTTKDIIPKSSHSITKPLTMEEYFIEHDVASSCRAKYIPIYNKYVNEFGG